jgi:transposase
LILIYYIGLVLLSRKEKERMVIQLANEGKTIREIAKIVHISLKDICKTINKETGMIILKKKK